jgi:hypothetical protein
MSKIQTIFSKNLFRSKFYWKCNIFNADGKIFVYSYSVLFFKNLFVYFE